jgi:prepilin-type N-terminal cleavage/methylation domain-containing protein
MKTLKAFSLIEVLLVVLILAVLASIVIPRVAESAAEAKAAKCDSNRANLISALERYALDNNGKYPPGPLAFRANVRNNTTYFPHGRPRCPYSAPYVYDGFLKTIPQHSH